MDEIQEFDENKRKLIKSLIKDIDNPEPGMFIELYSYCYTNFKLANNMPEAALGVLPYTLIMDYFQFDPEYLNRILRTEVMTGDKLIEAVYAGDKQALYIRQLYRLCTEVDGIVTVGIIKNEAARENVLFRLGEKLKEYNSSQPESSVSNDDLLNQYWHFVMKYAFKRGEVEKTKRSCFGKCYSELLEIYRTTEGNIEAVSAYVSSLHNKDMSE